jgi:hypothetical protein
VSQDFATSSNRLINPISTMRQIQHLKTGSYCKQASFIFAAGQ